jgi:hypothetical protein
MKREGDQEAGYCLKMLSDRGDRCLFTFLLFNVAVVFSSMHFRFLFVKHS